MTTFSQAALAHPPGSVVVPLWVWASSWEEKPDEEVCIGLRYLSDRELEDVRVQSYRECTDLFPDHKKSEAVSALFVASFQDRLIRWVIGWGTCDPNDVTKPWELFAPSPHTIPRDALSDKGAQFLYDAWERMRLATAIGSAPATDADIALLPELVKRLPSLAKSSRASEQRVRRLFRFCLEELEQVEAPLTTST